MSALAAIWIASLAGALLFTAAGFYWGRMRAWAALAAAEGAPLGVGPPLPAKETAPLEDDLARARAEIERLRACEARIATLESARADLERDNGTLARRAADADALRAKIDDVTQRLATAERRAGDLENLRGAEESRRELAIEAEVLRARLNDADYVRAENAALRAASRESSELRVKVRDLEERLAGNVPDLERTIREPQFAEGEGPARFREVLDRLAKEPAVRAVTIADDLGFPVETIGDHADALAALSGFLALVANKARQILPLTSVRRIVVVDDDDRTVTTARYLTEYGPLALVTLSDGPGPDWESRESGSRPRAVDSVSKTATQKK